METETLYRITPLSKYLALLLFILLPFLGGWVGYMNALTKEVVQEKYIYIEKGSVSDVAELDRVSNQTDLRKIFNLNSKATNTELFYSKEFGIGFTFNPDQSWIKDYSGKPAVISTSIVSNKISLDAQSDGQTIEIFEKNSTTTFEEAIKERFLFQVDPEKCFVVTKEKGDYIKAEIAYPHNTNPGAAWFELELGTESACPGRYSQTNGEQYFLYNPAVPNKYIFVRIGQDALTSDGGKEIWASSIQILE